METVRELDMEYRQRVGKNSFVDGRHGIRNYFNWSTRKYTRRWSCPVKHSELKCERFDCQELETCAAGEARVQIVPPFQLVALTELPTQQDYPAVSQ